MGEPALPHRLTAAVRRALGEIAPDTRVVVAVSGGADSIALLHLVRAARPDLVITVGHVRHGLRDDQADCAAARTQAEVLEVSFAERAAHLGEGEGPEDVARRARYDALAAIADLAGCDTVLLGHTADDQAETVLLRIARGTGPDGLGGMAADTRRSGLRLVRPLLGLRRADVRSVPPPGSWVEDPTNDDVDQRRARARHDVLPALQKLRPDEGDVVPSLCRLADLARRDADLLERLAARIPIARLGRALLVPRDLGAIPAGSAMHSRLLRAAWRLLPGPPSMPDAATIDRILALGHGSRLDAAEGVAVTASDHGWALCPDGGDPLPTRSLPLGGVVDVPEMGLRLRCRRSVAPPTAVGRASAATDPSAHEHPPSADRHEVAVDIFPLPWVLHLPMTDEPLLVGGRGDDGARDARAVLQSRVPAGLRHLAPLIRDGRGRLLAVADQPVVTAAPGGPCLLVEVTSSPESPVDGVGYPPRS